LYELLVLGKIEIDGRPLPPCSLTGSPQYVPKSASPTRNTTPQIGSEVKASSEIVQNMGFLIKFSSIVADNARVQFSIMLYVLWPSYLDPGWYFIPAGVKIEHLRCLLQIFLSKVFQASS